jgi:hypothetical protein
MEAGYDLYICGDDEDEHQYLVGRHTIKTRQK